MPSRAQRRSARRFVQVENPTESSSSYKLRSDAVRLIKRDEAEWTDLTKSAIRYKPQMRKAIETAEHDAAISAMNQELATTRGYDGVKRILNSNECHHVPFVGKLSKLIEKGSNRFPVRGRNGKVKDLGPDAA